MDAEGFRLAFLSQEHYSTELEAAKAAYEARLAEQRAAIRAEYEEELEKLRRQLAASQVGHFPPGSCKEDCQGCKICCTIVSCAKSDETGCQQLSQPCWALLVMLSNGEEVSLLWRQSTAHREAIRFQSSCRSSQPDSGLVVCPSSPCNARVHLSHWHV